MLYDKKKKIFFSPYIKFDPHQNNNSIEILVQFLICGRENEYI